MWVGCGVFGSEASKRRHSFRFTVSVDRPVTILHTLDCSLLRFRIALFQILADSDVVDFYQILSISRTATPSDVKAAYHRALLLYHPDKASNRSSIGYSTSRVNGDLKRSLEQPSSPSVDEIQKAYVTLFDPLLRVDFDARLTNSTTISEKGSQRPAEVVSLEEFAPVVDGSETLSYPCRCGGSYRVTEEQLEADVHLIGCQGCSEVVWVGYEVVEE